METHFLPSTSAKKTKSVKTGEKGWFGIEKTKTVEDGFLVDDIFAEMVEEYCQAYSKFLSLGEEKYRLMHCNEQTQILRWYTHFR